MIHEEKPSLEEALEHHGIKGMHWGVRKQDYPGASARTNHEAHKDAKEFARAKMFYGQGAGTRRKLINSTVAAKKAKDPSYAKAFEHHLAKQDMSTHASKARSERKSKDRRETTRKTTGAVARRLTGEMGTTAAFVGLAAAGFAYSRTPQGQAMMQKTMSTASKFVTDAQRRRAVSNLLKDVGSTKV